MICSRQAPAIERIPAGLARRLPLRKSWASFLQTQKGAFSGNFQRISGLACPKAMPND